MKKTIDLSEKEIEIVETYKKRNNMRSFSEAIRSMIRKVDFISIHIAPDSAGNVR